MAGHPDVSIVITTYNGWELTKKCLASLVESARSSALSAEIIISDNCSTDETPRAWQGFQNDKWPIRYRRNQENLGYLRNANAGAREARGSLLCLMNNDIIVRPGWLDAMVEVLRENEDVGLVGPKYVSAKGRVVECGGAIFSDGTAVQLGNGTPIGDPGFAYINDVHYCSMACVVLRTRLFRELNGYDERYIPAYYEDVDLCFRIAERGFRVVVDPLVRITHLFGGSHNLQETLQLMEKNRAALRERWKERLERLHPPPGTPPARLRSWPRGSTIVFHWSFLVNPDSTSGSLRNWRLLMETRRRGHHIVYVGMNQPVERPFLDILRKRGIEVRDHVSGLEHDLVRELASAHSISAAVMSFGFAEERFGHVYDLIDPEIVRIFDTVDVHFIRELRSRQDNASWGAIQRIEIGRWPESAYVEIASMLRCDAVLLVSEAEQQILTRDVQLPAEKFHIVSTIHEVDSVIRPFAGREGFSFIGYGGHPPNVDSIEYIVATIWPGIRRRLPQAQLNVYGYKLPPKVLALDNPAAGVFVRGFVEDHRAAIAASRVMLAPLRYGAGIKGKICEAFAVGTPVVTTPMGAEGIDGEGHALAVETDTQQFVDRAVEIYLNEDVWGRASRNGLSLVQRRFSAVAAGDRLMDAIAAGKGLRNQNTPWKSVAYAAMAPLKLKENPKDIAGRVGRKVSYALYRLRGSRNPLVQGLIKLLRERNIQVKAEARLNAIKPKPLRWLAKGIYYTLTLQLFRRWRARRTGKLAALLPLSYALGPGAMHFGDGRTTARPWLEVSPVRSRAEYEREMAQPVWQARARIEHLLAHDHRNQEEFVVPGFSILAGRPVSFLVDRLYGAELRDGVTIPRWRERLVCPVTQLTNRQRAMTLFLREYGGRVAYREGRVPDVLMFEQVTPLFQYLREAGKDWKFTGCEWLGPEVKPGAVVNGIRHEDCAALSLPDSSVDIVMSLDVFEHVPDPRCGFREKARVLRPGGVLLMTVPFFPERDTIVQRARRADGKLEHLLPPEYHGNPIDPEGGSLVYHDFGWDLLPMIREGGFGDAFIGLYWSLEYGHLGAPQTVFIATK
jgi:GT2 family glycosyltransferase/SAM-dependent methyltransferase